MSLKVVFAAYDRPDYVGGPNVWLRRILPAMRKAGLDIEVHFLTFGEIERCETLCDLQMQGIGIRHTPYHEFTEERVGWLLEQASIAKPDVYVPNLVPAAYYASRWIREAGIPTVGILHSDDAFHHGLIDEFVSKPGPYALSAVICVSRHLEDVCRKSAISDVSIHRIPYGVPVPDRSIDCDSPEFGMMYAGRLVTEQKRIAETTQAMCEAASAVPGVTGGLYGDGPQRGEMEKVLRAHAGTSVKYEGRVDGQSIQKYMLRNHAFVLLSDYEGLPIGLMEAMACGMVPVCTAMDSGIPELVTHGKTGLLVSDRKASFIEAVQSLQEDRALLKELSDNARSLIVEHYSSDIAGKLWMNLIDELTDKAQPAKRIRIPSTFDLPEPHPDLKREDTRSESGRQPVQMVVDTVTRMMEFDPFTAPKCRPSFIDLCTLRQSIFDGLRWAVPYLHGSLVDVGAGRAPYRQWLLKNSDVATYTTVDLDGELYASPDIVWDGNTLPLETDSADCVLLIEVLEHCPRPDKVVAEVQRILKPGGKLFLTVPYLWPLHDVPHDMQRFTPWSLESILDANSLHTMHIRALGGYEAALAQMIGLWVRRRSRSEVYRMLFMPWLSVLAAPLVALLSKADQPPEEFREGTMMTGMLALAEKRDEP